MIANRVKKNTLVYKALMKFLETLNIPVVATLRDSQNYIRAAELGQGLFEMKPNQVREDMEQWLPLIGWLAQRRPLHIAAGTPAITSAASVNSLPVMAPAAPQATSLRLPRSRLAFRHRRWPSPSLRRRPRPRSAEAAYLPLLSLSQLLRTLSVQLL